MPTQLTKASLSSARRQLLECFQQMNFGRLESLEIQSGEPVVDPLPRRQFEIKFSGENGPRPEVNSTDFALKQQVVELFAFFDELQNGIIDVLEIKHGLPFRMIVTEVPA
jgi:hypothetical protein